MTFDLERCWQERAERDPLHYPFNQKALDYDLKWLDDLRESLMAKDRRRSEAQVAPHGITFGRQGWSAPGTG